MFMSAEDFRLGMGSLDDALNRRQGIHMTNLHMTRRNQQPENAGLDERQRLGDEHDFALGYAVGDNAAKQREQHNGQKLQRADQAEGKGRLGEVVNYPRLRGCLHPCAAK